MSDYIPQAADVGTLTTGTFSGFWIETGTRSRADHVVIADGKGGCYEATPSKGVVHSPLSRYDGHPIAWDKHRDKTPEQRGREIYRRCADTEMPLDGSAVPDHFVAGAFNCLADISKLGWHADYATLFPPEGDE